MLKKSDDQLETPQGGRAEAQRALKRVQNGNGEVSRAGAVQPTRSGVDTPVVPISTLDKPNAAHTGGAIKPTSAQIGSSEAVGQAMQGSDAVAQAVFAMLTKMDQRLTAMETKTTSQAPSQPIQASLTPPAPAQQAPAPAPQPALQQAPMIQTQPQQSVMGTAQQPAQAPQYQQQQRQMILGQQLSSEP